MYLFNNNFLKKVINFGKNKLENQKFILNKKNKIIFNNLKNNLKLIKGHKNNTAIVLFEKDNFFRKFSQKKTGINKIKSEILAFKWYSKKIKKKIIKDYNINKKFAYLDTYRIEGRKMKSWNSLTENSQHLKRAINHYRTIFKKKKYHKIHGDLTLDNIFFTKSKIVFFDWEFHGSRKQLWGYDLIYLVLSSICIPYQESKRFSKTDEFHFLKFWKNLQKMHINKKLIFEPFKYLEKILKSDKVFIDSIKISKSKFFPLITPFTFKKRITNLISKNL